MESKEFLEALETLKKHLEQVNSAREQVDATVAAYNALQKELANYTNSLGEVGGNITELLGQTIAKETSLSADITTAINELKEACDHAASENKFAAEAVSKFFQDACTLTAGNFSQKCHEISEKLKTDSLSIEEGIKQTSEAAVGSIKSQSEDLSKILFRFNEEVVKIQEATNKMDEVKNGINLLSTNLADSQKDQDVVLNEISTGVQKIINQQSENSASFSTYLVEMEKNLGLAISHIGQETTSNITSAVETILGTMQSGMSDINSSFAETKSEIKESSNMLTTMVERIQADLLQKFGKVPLLLYLISLLNIIILALVIIK